MNLPAVIARRPKADEAICHDRLLRSQSSLAMTALCLCLVAAGCKSPFDRTRDASGGGGTGTLSGSSNFVIFSDELKTGGGAFEYPGGENQSLSFADTSNPISRRSIRY